MALRVIFFYFLIFFIPFVSAATDRKNCEDFYARFNALDKNLGEAYYRVRSISPVLMNGVYTPTEIDLENLDALLKAIREGKRNVTNAGIDAELQKTIADFAAGIKINPWQIPAGRWNPTNADLYAYLPRDYKLRVLFQRKITEINRELPKSLKIPVAHIPFDRRRISLPVELKKLMKNLNEKFGQRFSTSGFESVDAFKSAASSAGKRAERLHEIFEKEQIDVVMYVPENVRNWTTKVGFHNLHVTGSTRGAGSTTESRNMVEAAMVGLSENDYKILDNELKPKYALLLPKSETGLRGPPPSEYFYGKDMFVFKLDAIRNRLTITPGDSLARGETIYDKRNIFNPASWAASWNAMFIPWKYRTMVAPELYGVDEVWSVERWGKGGASKWNETEKNALTAFSQGMPPTGGDYVEAQIFGSLSLDDVSEFRFTENPPSGEFLIELQKRNIKIMDARQDKIVPWHPNDKQ